MKSSLLRLYRQEMRSTVQLSYPIVIAQLGSVLMNVAANMMVGRLGAASIASVGIANSIFILVAVVGMGTLAVLAPQVATARGRNDLNECRGLLRTAIRLAIGLGVVLALILLGLAAAFAVFRQEPEVTRLARNYLSITAVSIIPMMVFMGLKSYTDGLSHTRVAMVITLTGLVLDVFLNWVLIYGSLGGPALGVYGAGLAVLLTRIYMATAMFVYLRTSPLFRPYWQAFTGSIRPLANRVVRLGLPGGFQYFFEVGAFSGSAVMAGWIGTPQLAAHEIAISLAALAYMVAAGNAAAGSIRVGEAVGKGSRAAVIRAGTAAILIGGGFMFLTCLLFITANEPLVELYIKDNSVLPIATSLLVIAGIFQISDGVQVAGLGILRALSDVNIPTVVTLFAYWIIGIPLGYWLAFSMGMGVQGIWYGLLAGLTASAALLTVRFYVLSRKINLGTEVNELKGLKV
jgi:MATE family multidrug resistance protein